MINSGFYGRYAGSRASSPPSPALRACIGSRYLWYRDPSAALSGGDRGPFDTVCARPLESSLAPSHPDQCDRVRGPRRKTAAPRPRTASTTYSEGGLDGPETQPRGQADHACARRPVAGAL